MFVRLILITALFLNMMGTKLVAQTFLYHTFLAPDGGFITIDGDLSDWRKLSLVPQAIQNVIIRKRIPERPENGADLSGNFRCFVDKDNLYVAVEVFDDKVVFGRTEFGESHKDDSVEIFIDGDPEPATETGYDFNDGQIRISQDKRGRVRLEGIALFGRKLMILPGLWECLGVVAAVKRHPKGYKVEVKIPKLVFISSPMQVGSRFGLNVTITDNDGHGPESKLSWSSDPYDMSWMSTRFIGHVQVEKQANYPW